VGKAIVVNPLQQRLRDRCDDTGRSVVSHAGKNTDGLMDVNGILDSIDIPTTCSTYRQGWRRPEAVAWTSKVRELKAAGMKPATIARELGINRASVYLAFNATAPIPHRR
jgi:hypothetical protein